MARNRAKLIFRGIWKMKYVLCLILLSAAVVGFGLWQKPEASETNPASVAATPRASLLMPSLVIIALACFYAWRVLKRPENQTYACTRCHAVATGQRNEPGNLFWEIVLFCFFVLPWIIYRIWLGSKRRVVCSVCGSDAIVPLTSPEGQRIVAVTQPAVRA